MITCNVKKSAYDEFLADNLQQRLSIILTDRLGAEDAAKIAVDWLKSKLLQSAETFTDIGDLTGVEVANLLINNIQVETDFDKRMLTYHIGWFDDYVANLATIVEYGTQVGENPFAASKILTQMLLSQESTSFFGLVEASVYVSLNNALKQIEVV